MTGRGDVVARIQSVLEDFDEIREIDPDASVVKVSVVLDKEKKDSIYSVLCDAADEIRDLREMV